MQGEMEDMKRELEGKVEENWDLRQKLNEMAVEYHQLNKKMKKKIINNAVQNLQLKKNNERDSSNSRVQSAKKEEQNGNTVGV